MLVIDVPGNQAGGFAEGEVSPSPLKENHSHDAIVALPPSILFPRRLLPITSILWSGRQSAMDVVRLGATYLNNFLHLSQSSWSEAEGTLWEFNHSVMVGKTQVSQTPHAAKSSLN